MKILSSLLLLLGVALGLPAQQPAVTPDSRVDSSTLRQWLHSADPRLIAWAADFARRTHDTQLLSEIAALLPSAPLSSFLASTERQQEQRDAVLAMLDALIQENSVVSLPTITAIATSFPAQASILITRYPLPLARPTLESWASSGTTTAGGGALARIAAMLLAK